MYILSNVSTVTAAQAPSSSPLGLSLVSNVAGMTELVTSTLVPTLVLPEGLRGFAEICWCASADGHSMVGNDRWHTVTGIADAGGDWTRAVHAEDRAALDACWRDSIANGTPFEATVRLDRTAGGCVWVLARAVAVLDGNGSVRHWLGTATDIDAIKTGTAEAQLIAAELAHRIGNIFAVVGSVLALSAREYPEAAEYSRTAAARIAALGTSHAFIWPAALAGEPTMQRAKGLIARLLQPYGDVGGPYIDQSGDDVAIDSATATCITLIVHELATNAAKYGSLSNRNGRLAVRLRRTPGHLTLLWSESGGPAITELPARSGFGSALTARLTKLGQVSHLRRRWRSDGLFLAIRFTLPN